MKNRIRATVVNALHRGSAEHQSGGIELCVAAICKSDLGIEGRARGADEHRHGERSPEFHDAERTLI